MHRHPLALSLVWMLGSVGCSDYFLMHQEILIESGVEQFLGGSCEQVSDDESDGSGLSSDLGEFSIDHEGTDEGVNVTVRVRGVTRARRFYSESFLATGHKDEFLVPLTDSASLRLKHWGGSECESFEPPL